MTRHYTEEDVRDALRRRIAQTGRRGVVASAFGVSPQALTMILRGQRGISDAMARALGFRRVVRYLRSS